MLGFPLVECLPPLSSAPTALAEALTAPAEQHTPGADFAGHFVQGPWRKHKELHRSLS